MQSMRTPILVVLALVASASIARAQSPTELPAPDDFKVYGSLDIVMPVDASDTFTTAKSVIMAGWVFECRSGLQPQTQRVGQFSAYWSRRLGDSRFGEVQWADISAVYVAQRPDVPIARRDTCPSVGQNVGFYVVAAPPDEQADWTLNLAVTTFDGAGHSTGWQGRADVRVWYEPMPHARKR